MSLLLTGGEVYTENSVLTAADLLIEDGLITAVGNEENKAGLKEIDLTGYKVIPGLIDLHIHGANGYDVMDSSYQALNFIANYLANNGVTNFLPTTVTANWSKLKSALKNIDQTMHQGTTGAEILGAYVEGPYISKEKKGAHPEEFIRSINLADIKKILNYSNNIKLFALAPEKENSLKLIKFLSQNGIEVSLGHTNASYEETEAAVNSGAKLAVHAFNGMKGLHHRKPGVVGSVLSNDQLNAELIADNIHVHQAVMKILYNCKGKDGICLISDCMRAGGLEDGEYTLGELDITVKDSIARTKSGSLAGSTLRLIDAVKNIVELVGVDLSAAIQMAALNPARLLGLDEQLGSIKEGKKANLAVIDEDYEVMMTIINGELVYQANSF
ncbi:N-acetylglucosamine-6-phosphate deacetylase [Sporohalobacter salinus]|uniref:N-acetylglucosamine-6-phosphate deacetylase n=1 Tax=Sporohalobacter salinus TaxID=1494606 RepID=UPI001961E940|nr:N-acetylglucosamine-6-phosphate deacetylase [Sporohalobacter salinus]MBM7624583.1 N-acetylglucosamine-6-phosphate deacetylase [Sporohalobacter salinus]